MVSLNGKLFLLHFNLPCSRIFKINFNCFFMVNVTNETVIWLNVKLLEENKYKKKKKTELHYNFRKY